MRPFRVPPRFQEAVLGSLDKRQFGEVIEYSKNFRRNLTRGEGLLLSGPPGVGKTWAIVALTRAYVDSTSQDYEFVTAPDMFDNLGDFGERVDDYRQQSWVRTYGRVPWLVLNDLGKEYKGGKLAAQVPTMLGRILRTRSELKLVTHVTTNLVSKELGAAYGDTVMSLLAEMTSGLVVSGKDRRRG